MYQTPVATPLESELVSKSGIAPACNLKTRLSKRRREEEYKQEEASSTRAEKGNVQERDKDECNEVEDGVTDRESDTPSEQDDAELHTSTQDVRRDNAHPIAYNKYLPHFPLNTTPSPHIYDAHLQHASIRPKDLYDLIAYHHAMHNAAHLHGYYSSTKHGTSYATTTTHTFVHKGQQRGFH